MFSLTLLFISVRTLGLVTLNVQVNQHPPLATSPHPQTRPANLLCDLV
jgi:hypothetical protein